MIWCFMLNWVSYNITQSVIILTVPFYIYRGAIESILTGDRQEGSTVGD